MDCEFVIWVFVGCCAPVGFCWLCSGGGFLLVMGVRFVGLAVGVTVSLRVGCGCHCWCGHGHGSWLCAGFFCLGYWVAMVVRSLATAVVQCLICGAGLAVLWVAVW